MTSTSRYETHNTGAQRPQSRGKQPARLGPSSPAPPELTELFSYSPLAGIHAIAVPSNRRFFFKELPEVVTCCKAASLAEMHRYAGARFSARFNKLRRAELRLAGCAVSD